MRAKEIRSRSAEEMETMLADTKSQLFQLRLKNATHQLTDTSEIKTARREISRIKTVIRERAMNPAAFDGEGEEK